MTIRKFTSILLTMVMLVSISVITASAAYDAVIAENETVQVSASFDEIAVVKFVPTESKTLTFKSEMIETYAFCTLYDENNEWYESSEGSLIDMNFAITYDFEAGKTYYFDIRTYSDDVVTFNVTLECAHSYVGDTCENCGNVCDHNTDINLIRVCECGSVFDGTDIACGDTVAVSGENEIVVFRFVPEETDAYIFRSNGPDADPYGLIFFGKQFYEGNDDFGEGYDFLVFAELTAGEAYYFLVEEYNGAPYEISLTKAVHTAEDGSEHTVEFHDYNFGTCKEIVYTPGLYCAECDKYIEGHLAEGFGFHDDYDWDGYCDYCDQFLYVTEDDSLIDLVSDFLESLIGVIEFFRDFFVTLFTTLGIW